MYFTENVQTALEMVFLSWQIDTIKDGQALLKKYADAGDADACALVSRTYAGSQFIWEGAKLPEDDRACFFYLYKAVEKRSSVGILLAMRAKSLLTPLLRETITECKEQAFLEVLKGAEEGDAYCQYVIGNVFYWGDYEEIGPAAIRHLKEYTSWFSWLRHMNRADKIEYRAGLARQVAIKWLQKALDNGFVVFTSNLRNLYLEEKNYQKARAVAEISAKQGNPYMQYWMGIYAEKEDKDNASAFAWYTLGAEKEDSSALEELGDMYFYGKYPDRDIETALTYYERGAEAGNTYCICQCAYVYGGGIPEVEVDWGRAAYWAALGLHSDRHTDLLPFVGYILLHGYGLRQNIELGVGLLLQAYDEDKRREEANQFKYRQRTKYLWQSGLIYAYDHRLLDGMVSDDEIKKIRQSLLDLKDEGRMADYSPEKDSPLCISVQANEKMPAYRTSSFTWDMVEKQIIENGALCFFQNSPKIIPGYLSDLVALVVTCLEGKDTYDVGIYGFVDMGEAEDIHEIRYMKSCSRLEALQIAHNYYEQRTVPDLSEWEKEYWHQYNEEQYVLEIDEEELLLSSYKEGHKRILEGLQGIFEGDYKKVFLYMKDLYTGSFFIYRDPEKQSVFLLHVLVPQEEGCWALYEYRTDNLMQVHLWIHQFYVEQKYPEWNDWKEIRLIDNQAYEPLLI